ncbi:hypothetical protein TNCV_4180791 [Trichonephila clavipes]|nr:hypothetical protein TNCV_4180791 [Trichonephila clavipes]
MPPQMDTSILTLHLKSGFFRKFTCIHFCHWMNHWRQVSYTDVSIVAIMQTVLAAPDFVTQPIWQPTLLSSPNSFLKKILQNPSSKPRSPAHWRTAIRPIAMKYISSMEISLYAISSSRLSETGLRVPGNSDACRTFRRFRRPVWLGSSRTRPPPGVTPYPLGNSYYL